MNSTDIQTLIDRLRTMGEIKKYGSTLYSAVRAVCGVRGVQSGAELTSEGGGRAQQFSSLSWRAAWARRRRAPPAATLRTRPASLALGTRTNFNNTYTRGSQTFLPRQLYH